jgi:hypothetical protein
MFEVSGIIEGGGFVGAWCVTKHSYGGMTGIGE